MFVRVRVIVGERNGLLVPEEAIVPQGEEFYVYKVVDGAARRVPVKIGVRRDAQVEIVRGRRGRRSGRHGRHAAVARRPAGARAVACRRQG